MECKAEGKISSDDWLQAESYAQRIGAPHFVVTDGTKQGWQWYETGKRQSDSKLIKRSSIPDFEVQKEGKTLIKFEDLNSLKRIIQQCHDIIRNEEGKDPAESFDEMSKLLFAKMKDEKDHKKEKKLKPNLKKEPAFKIRTDKNGTIDTDTSVAKRVRSLFEKAKSDFPKIYETTQSKNIKKLVTINLKDNTIYQIVGIIEPYSLVETSVDKHGIDLKGAMFEIFLKGTFRGSLGQFFTPREIIEFMVKVIDPKENETVLDPGCGSGGFLIETMKHVNDELNEKFIVNEIHDLGKKQEDYAKNNLFGMDINERLAWVCKMNMVFHGDGHGGIVNSNALNVTSKNKEIVDRQYDVILTNPPFGSKINDQIILSDSRFKDVARLKLTEVLFLSLCINLLKPGGRLGILLPDSILTNSSLKVVRDYIKRETIVKSIVSVPPETFLPYGAGVKTSLLFLEKKDLMDPYQEQGKVFMAIAENIGYDATGRKTGKNDLEDVFLEKIHEFNEEYYSGD